MKLVFTLLLITFGNYFYSQNCIYTVGDVYTLKKQTAIIREKPNAEGKILANIKTNSGNLTFEIVENLTANNFVKVIASVLSPEAVPELAKYDSLIGWVSTNSIEPEFYYPENWDLAYYEKEIEKQLDLKFANDCKYSTELHAHLLSQKGIQEYKAGEYYSAVRDLTTSISMHKEYKFILRSYIYRALSKEKLADYLGAIEDFNLVISQSNIPTKKQDISNYSTLKKESEWYTETLFVQRAICKIQTNDNLGALKDLNQILKINPKWAKAYYIRGQLRDVLKDKLGGCKDLSKAGELGIEEAYEEIKKRCNK